MNEWIALNTVLPLESVFQSHDVIVVLDGKVVKVQVEVADSHELVVARDIKVTMVSRQARRQGLQAQAGETPAVPGLHPGSAELIPALRCSWRYQGI